jgi:hypothetical protein
MKTTLFLFCLLTVLAPAWSETAVFREVQGKVEYQTKGDDWLPAKVGVEIPVGTAVSTGFKSNTAIEILGSVVYIKPLTRIVIDQLTRNSVGTKTNLTLLSGKVKAEVKPSSATLETAFNVKGPTATASVRGTGFEFDGENLLVNHGEVNFVNRWNINRSVKGGEYSSAGKGASVSPPVPVKAAEKPVITSGGGSEEVDALFAPATETVPGSLPPATGFDLSSVISVFGDQLVITEGGSTASDLTSKLKDIQTPISTVIATVVIQ